MSAELRLEQNEIVVGRIEDVHGAGATCRLDEAAIQRLAASSDQTLKSCGAIGSQLKVKLEGQWLLAEVRELKQIRDNGRSAVMAAFEFIGEADATGEGLTRFRPGVSAYPRPGAPVCAVTEQDMARAFAAEDKASITIGAIHPTMGVPARIYIDRFLSRHFAVFGSTGSGKSTLVCLLLHKIAQQAPESHIVVIDPHGEYANSFKTKASVLDASSLVLPYWLMNLEEHCEFFASPGSEREIDRDILSKCLLAARAKNPLASQISNLNVDTPLPYFLSDLVGALDQQLGRLEKFAEARHYIRLKLKIEQLASDARFRFIFNESYYFTPLASVIAGLLRLPSEGRPICIVDLSTAPSEVMDAVVAVVCRLVFSFGLWSREGKSRPVLLLCEEAQHYLPREQSTRSVAARTILDRIAKEGRKHGVSLGLVTQRPSDLSEGALSQCGTLIAMRLNNIRDQECLKNALPEAGKHLMDSIQALRNRECIVSGEGVLAPIRVRVEELGPDLLPNSRDQSFSLSWAKSGGEEEAVQGAVDRWLNQAL